MIQLKICLIGAYAVGKTSLVARISRGIFSERYLATLGVKIDRKKLMVRGGEVKLILWDMAGEDEFAKVNMSYLRGASGYLLVIDGTRRFTLEQALVLEQRVRRTVGLLPYEILVNKSDLEADWEVTGADLRKLAADNLKIHKTSAKTGSGVEPALVHLVENILDIRMPGKEVR